MVDHGAIEPAKTTMIMKEARGRQIGFNCAEIMTQCPDNVMGIDLMAQKMQARYHDENVTRSFGDSMQLS